MKKASTRIISIAVVIASLLLFLPSVAFAAGIGVAPSTLEVNDALRGGEFDRVFTIFNTGEEASAYTLNATGEAGSWISFYDLSDPDIAIEEVTIPGKGNAKVLVKFSIPEDAASGEHGARIFVATTAVGGDEGGSGQAVELGMPVDVVITVTGTQILTGEVNSVIARDTEVGYLLRIEVHFRNTGNVVATPQIDVEIAKDAATIDSLTFAETKVNPEKSEAIPVEWDTDGRELGDYAAQVAVSLDEEVIATQKLNFAILPVGTLTRVGVFEELAFQGEAKLGTLTKVQATFLNTGQIDTKAKFIGELYCDNELIDTLESEETLVPVGQSDILASYVTPEKDGDYEIKGYINYEGKKTEVKEISFSIGGAGGGHSFNWFILAVTAIAILAGILAYMAIRRKRGKPA